MNIKVRLGKIELAFRPPGKTIVWYSDSGKPVPKVGPEDLLIKVIYEDPDPPSWWTPDYTGEHADYWNEVAARKAASS